MASPRKVVAASLPASDDGGDRMRSRYRVSLLVVSLVSLCVGAVIGRYGFPEAEKPLLLGESTSRFRYAEPAFSSAVTEPGLPTVTPMPLQVYVSGAVQQPQVVLIAPGSLVQDALLAAGGALEEADLGGINLASPLSDHQHIRVPYRSGASIAAQSVITQPGAWVNINTASAADLEALPGIGPTRAQEIVAYRQEHGPFAHPEDIQNVKGIGSTLFEMIAPFITTGP